MSRVLVTGGTGTLGHSLVPRLLDAGYEVKVLTRRSQPQLPQGARSVRGDLTTGDGLIEAVHNADVVIHAASQPFRRTGQVDVEGTERLLGAALRAEVPHLIYLSIVGVDRHPLAHYRRKFETELLIESGRVPYTILRATHFHQLLHRALRSWSRLGPAVVPKGFRFQLIDATEVSDRVVELAAGKSIGRAPDMGGPDVRRIENLAALFLRACGRRPRLLRVPIPGAAARAFRAGVNTCPDQAVGRITWEDYLRARKEAQQL